MRTIFLPLLLSVLALALACGDRGDERPAPISRSCADPAARQVVEELGGRMKQVSLLAPDSLLKREIRRAYTSLATPDLLASWLANPAGAPGRQLSSPWPERIEIDSFVPAGGGECSVAGRIVYVTSTDPSGATPAAVVPVTLHLVSDGEWRVGAYEAAPPPAPSPGAAASSDAPGALPAGSDDGDPALADPADVIRGYYAAINAKDYRRAYGLWGNGGTASGQSFDSFAAGFARTANVAVEIGDPGRVEGAAGSRYVEIPVVVRATTDDGDSQRFSGSYTLRRSVVDGATAAQRRWHIDSASLETSP